MNLEIAPFTKKHVEKVKHFNKRLKESGISYTFPTNPLPSKLPKIDDRTLYQEYFLALHGNHVRGAYILKTQNFYMKKEIKPVGICLLPISEGIIDKRYAFIGIELIIDTLRKRPFSYALGIGGFNEPIARIYKKLNWKMLRVPFYFKVFNAHHFFKNISYLKQKQKWKIIIKSLEISGVGWLILKTVQMTNYRKIRKKRTYIEAFDTFKEWADVIWQNTRDEYTLAAVRNSEVLNILYPQNSERFIKLKILDKNNTLGWVVLLESQMNNHKQFGNMRVGSIVDCFAHPKNAGIVVQRATEYLQGKHVDIIVSNQTHTMWCEAFKKTGYIKGPSNFILTLSPQLSQILEPLDSIKNRFHFTRGDGDGPINL